MARMFKGERQYVKSLKRVAYWEAQCATCPYCGKEIPHPSSSKYPFRTVNADHVFPQSAGYGKHKNVLYVHKPCNQKKQDRMPYACEVLFLDAVNERLYPDEIG